MFDLPSLSRLRPKRGRQCPSFEEGAALVAKVPNALTNQQFVFHADSGRRCSASPVSLFDIRRKPFRFREIQFRLIAQKEKERREGRPFPSLSQGAPLGTVIRVNSRKAVRMGIPSPKRGTIPPLTGTECECLAFLFPLTPELGKCC